MLFQVVTTALFLGWYAVQAYILGACLYVLSSAVIFLLFFTRIKGLFRRSAQPLFGAVRTNFILLIPAHNEEQPLPLLLASIQRLNYSAEQFTTVVIADNCTDRTASVAREAGALCFERYTTVPSDKTQALQHGYSKIAAQAAAANAVICIIDADCVLDPDYLTELDCLYSQPNAPMAVQSYRSVSNKFESDVTVLDAAAEALRQWVQSGTRQWLGQDVFLFGLGSSMRESVFAKVVALPSTSLAEDKEWKVYLTSENIRVAYCPTARLSYEVVSDVKAFQQQRNRWLTGYYQSFRTHGISMLLRGIRGANLAQLDLAGDLLQLPRSILVLAALFFGLLAQWFSQFALVSSWVWLGVILAFGVYGSIGLRLIGARPRHYLLLFSGFKLMAMVIKLSGAAVLGRGVEVWAATRRKRPKAS